jgi:hypothetical protein
MLVLPLHLGEATRLRRLLPLPLPLPLLPLLLRQTRLWGHSQHLLLLLLLLVLLLVLLLFQAH